MNNIQYVQVANTLRKKAQERANKANKQKEKEELFLWLLSNIDEQVKTDKHIEIDNQYVYKISIYYVYPFQQENKLSYAGKSYKARYTCGEEFYNVIKSVEDILKDIDGYEVKNEATCGKYHEIEVLLKVNKN